MEATVEQTTQVREVLINKLAAQELNS